MVPPGKVSGKFTAPVPSATVERVAGSPPMPDVLVLPLNTQPAPAGVAPVTFSPVLPDGTICLVTDTEPVQLPSARLRSAWPASA